MKKAFNLISRHKLFIFVPIVVAAILMVIFAGCGGSGGNSPSVLSGLTTDTPIVSDARLTQQPTFQTVAQEDAYYEQLEQNINAAADAASSTKPVPNDPTALKKLSLSKTKDTLPAVVENATTSTSIAAPKAYDLSAVTATATLADGTRKPVPPVWSIYSGPGSLSRTAASPAVSGSPAGFAPSLSTAPVSIMNLSQPSPAAKAAEPISAADGPVYFIPAAAAGTTVLSATYTDGVVKRTALFRISVTSLQSISLALKSDSVKAPGTYDLSKIRVTVGYTNNTTKDVTGDPKIAWTLITGKGVLNGSVYSPPADPETAVIEASYYEDGITRKENFSLKVITITSIGVESKGYKKIKERQEREKNIQTNSLSAPAGRAPSLAPPISVTVNPNEDLVVLTSPGPTTYDLSTVVVTAYYSDGSSAAVTPGPDTVWVQIVGLGTLSGNTYTATAATETATFRVIHTKETVSKWADFTLYVVNLNSISLSITSSTIQGNQTFDLGAIAVTANYSNSTTLNVTIDPATVWTKTSGLGTLSGKVYTATPAGETATFQATYTENGVAKTATFALTVTGVTLSSIALNPTGVTLVRTDIYDLSLVAVTATYSNGTTLDVSAGTTWALISGGGSLAGKIYTAPNPATTAIVRASYTQGGVTRTADFTIKVLRLSSVALTQTSGTIATTKTFDLGTVTVVATYSDGSTEDVTNDSATTWAKTTGLGTLAGKIYTATATPETATLTVTFKPSSKPGKTANFTLNVVAYALSSIALSPTSYNRLTLQSYDLANVVVTATYTDLTTKIVSPSTTWAITSGGGTLAGTVFTAPNFLGATTLTATYTEGAVTRTATFTINTVAYALSSIALSPSSIRVLVSQTYDVSNILVTATYTDFSTQNVSAGATWAKTSGVGTLAGTIYTAPGSTGTAVLTATYVEGGVTKTATLNISVVTFNSITLSPTSATIAGAASYDLSAVTVTANYSDGTTQNVSSPTTWSKVSGLGTLAGKVYTATSVAETAVMRASYVEGGVTKTKDFNITVNGTSLTSITLVPTSTAITGTQTYDLSNVKVIASYSNSVTAEVTASPNVTWTKTSGLGSLASKIYTSTSSPEAAVMKATYVENGVTVNANFTINVVSLSSIFLGPTSASWPANQDFDFSTVTVTALYSNSSTKNVGASTTWTKTTGLGTLAGKIYTPTGVAETATFTASYTEAGVTKTAVFTLNLYKALTSITLSPTSAGILGNQTYDLSVVTVTATYSDGTTANVTASANTTWAKTSGLGSLAGKIYTATGASETATLTASYIEAGIIKSAPFTLTVTKALTSLSLSPASATILVSQTYDVSAVTVTATYSDSSTADVTANVNTTWAKTSGLGTFAGKVYTATATPETATITASYVENGVTKTSPFTLTVAKALTSITLSPTSATILTSQTYDVSAVTVTATYSDSSTADVTANVNTTWAKTSGLGTFAGKVYTATASPETATITASYVENGVTKTAAFTIYVAAKTLTSISLSPTSANILASQTYDLSAVTVTATYSDSSTADVTADVNTTWAKTSGLGTLVGKIYTPTGSAETATLTASYTESGVTKTAPFTLNVAKALTSISLAPSSANIQTSQTYDVSAVTVTATYSDSSTADVTANVNTTWAKTSGLGTFVGKVYTATASPETATITASYVEGGVTRTAAFTINVTRALTSISLAPSSTTIRASQTYDLSVVSVIAAYADGTTADVSLNVNTVWSKISGLGTLLGKVYTATAAAETAVLRASYTESGITKTADFSLKVNELTSLALSPNAATILPSATYDLSAVTVVAGYLDGTTADVSLNVNTSWSKTSGLGSLVGKVYTATAASENAVLTASYVENGVTKTTDFALRVVSLSSISLTPTSATIGANATYDLATVTVTATYSDSTTANVTSSPNTTWVKTTGLGTLAGKVYTSTATAETATFTATYVENGVSRSAVFTINVVTDTIAPTVALSDSYVNTGYEDFIPSGTTNVITAVFTDASLIDETTPPKITISGATSTTVVNNVTMTKLTNKAWKYTWLVPNAVPYKYYYVSISAKDVAGNACAAPTGQTKYVIYNPVTVSKPYPPVTQ